jgi:hypothetical protein
LTVRNLICIFLFVNALWPTFGVAQEGERIMFVIPKTWGAWKTVTNKETDKQTFIERIPESQDISAIRDIIVEQSFAGLAPNATPMNFLTLMIHAAAPANCEQFLAFGPFAGDSFYSPAAYGRYFCSKLKDKPYGIVSVMKATRAKGRMYVIQREWRLQPFDLNALNSLLGLLPRPAFGSEAEALSWYEAYTATEALFARSFFICDSRDPLRPCPK